ncbi:FAD-binding domain-containing protein [Aphanothece microscopica]|uniref:FAD-binding domain-containing protein n=1 Tax=Aphanothece microscopica TaxID=1049561 RepID=UPI003CE51430
MGVPAAQGLASLRPRPWLPGVCPPRPAAGSEPSVWLIDRRRPEVQQALPELAALLSGEERQRLEAFRRDDDRERFLLGRSALRQLLGTWLAAEPRRLPVVPGPHGKPLLQLEPPGADGMQFNVAHSGDLVVLAFHPFAAVGVDLERRRPGLLWQPIARRMLPPQTVERLVQLPPAAGGEEFLQQWCLLEAGLKARGVGITGRRAGASQPLAPSQWWTLQLPVGYWGGLCLLAPQPEAARREEGGAWADGDLPRTLADRAALEEALARLFPTAAGSLSPLRGGVAAAAARLASLDPIAYGRTRNHLDGAVTGLSPYIRHGVLTLAEVREAVWTWLEARGYRSQSRRADARQLAGKLINELGWRDYWLRLWLQLADGIWHDLDPLRTGHPATAYAPDLPPDIAAGRTGLACMDAFVAELTGTGWLHNHARLWLASYVVHWRRVRWQAGARWFLQHLLDGDPASNNLSWQWVASSFSTKPYIFNRANLERFAGDRHCRSCALAATGGCPFQASYESLELRLFPAASEGSQPPAAPSPGWGSTDQVPTDDGPPPALQRPIVWVHGEALGPTNPALRAWPAAPALFVFDRALIEALGLSRKRLGFLYECLLELPVTLRQGDVADEVLAFAARHGADGVVTCAAVDPRFGRIRERVAARLPVRVLEPEPFVALDPAPDLRRFSRYWRRAEPAVWRGFG